MTCSTMIPNLMEHRREQEPELNGRSELHIEISVMERKDGSFMRPDD